MSKTETFQITPEQAELYEAQFVPAIFAQWAPRLVDFTEVGPGDRVLDVACGTGIVGRTAAATVGDSGHVVGLDLNPAMLGVAQRLRPDLAWQQGDAGELPFDDGTFDVVVCQMALMFFADRAGCLAEMARVASRRVAVVVPSSIDNQPAYSLLTDVVAEHAGPDGASLIGAYWSAGDIEELTRLLSSAGLDAVTTTTVMGTAHFPSIDALVATEVEGSPLIHRISEETYARIREDARQVLAPFTTATGAVEAPLECRLARGDRHASSVPR